MRMTTVAAAFMLLVAFDPSIKQEASPPKTKIYVAVWDTSLTQDPKTGRIKSSNPGHSHVVVIDAASGAVTTKIPVGDCPMRLGMTRDGRYLYVPCQMSDKLSIIDTETDTVTKTIPLVGGQGVDFLPDGGRAFISSSKGVLVVDTRANAVVKTLPYKEGYYVRTSPDGATVVVTGYRHKSYALIDTATETLKVREFPDADSGSKGVSFCPDGKRMVMVTGSHRLSVIDVASGDMLKHITLKNRSWLCIVEVIGDGIAYVTDSNEQHIYQVNLADETVKTMPTAGIGAIGLVVDPGGNLWTTDFLGDGKGRGGVVSVIRDGNVVKSIKVGSTPTGIAIKSSGGNRGS